jgi:Arc/MetJ-type ribon-helix-helix transcriptional regulator
MYVSLGDTLNINIGAPFEAKLRKIIAKGYAGNQTEALRQAIVRYEQDLEAEEAELLSQACEAEFEKMAREGRTKLYSLAQIKKEAGL